MEKCSHCEGIRFADDIHVHAGSGEEEMFVCLWWDKKGGPTEEHLFAKVCTSCGTVNRFYIKNPRWLKLGHSRLPLENDDCHGGSS